MDKITGILNTDCVRRAGRAQIEVDCELKADNTIVTLLGVSADAITFTAEGLSKEASVTGRVDYKAIYLDEEGEISSLDYYTDFRTSVEVDTEASTKLFAFAKVIEVLNLSTSDTGVVLRAIVEIDIVSASKRGVNYHECEELCTKTVEIDESCLKDVAEGTFDIYEEYESGCGVDKILLLDTDLVLKDGKPSRGSLLVSGMAVSNLCYKSGKEIKNLTLKMPFCEELECSDVTPLDDVYLYGYVKDARVILSGDEENTVIKVEVTVSLRVPVFETGKRTIPEDGYDCTKTVKLSIKEGESYIKTGDWNREERLSGTVSIPEDGESVGRILAICSPKDNVENVRAQQDSVMMDGTMSCIVLYEDIDGFPRSITIELPYSVDFSMEGSEIGAETYVRTAVCDVTAVVKRAREIEVMYVLKVYAYQCKRQKFSYIEDYVEEGALPPALPITIYKRRAGEDLWQIAKTLRVPLKDIQDSEGDFIVCYHQID